MLLYPKLLDVKRSGHEFTAEMSSSFLQWPLNIQYELACDSTVAQNLLQQRDPFKLFAVIAQLDTVNRREESAITDDPKHAYSFDDPQFTAAGTAEEAIALGAHGFGLSKVNMTH